MANVIPYSFRGALFSGNHDFKTGGNKHGHCQSCISWHQPKHFVLLGPQIPNVIQTSLPILEGRSGSAIVLDQEA